MYRQNRSTYSKKSLEKLFADSKGRKIPARYLQGLSGDAREKRIEELEQRRDEYDEMWADGKATQDELDHVFRDFETDKRVRKKPSSYTVEAKRRGIVGSNRDKALAALKYYGVSTSKENVDKVTKELEKIYSKGIAAWASGGHRPGASKWNWAAARVNSFLVGGKAFFTADKTQANNLPKGMREAIRSEAIFNYTSLPKKKRRSAKHRKRNNPNNGSSILWVLGAYFAYKKLNDTSVIQDRSSVDWYTLAHFFYGAIAKQSFDWSNSDILLGAVAYEIIEPPVIKWMKRNWPDAGWGYETKHNIYTDILAAMVGAYIGE